MLVDVEKQAGLKLPRLLKKHFPPESKFSVWILKAASSIRFWLKKGLTLRRKPTWELSLIEPKKASAFICSAEGGVEIEVVAEETPEKILRFHAYSTEFS